MLCGYHQCPVIHGREARATTNEHHADLDSTELFGSNPNLDGASQSPRSHDAGAIAATDRARLQTSATQDRPRFVCSADESCRFAIYVVINVAIQYSICCVESIYCIQYVLYCKITIYMFYKRYCILYLVSTKDI